MPNVEYEVTKGVGKVVQELHEMFELVFFFYYDGYNIYIYVVGQLGRRWVSLRWWWTSRMTGTYTRW